jgi:hypothetical protein
MALLDEMQDRSLTPDVVSFSEASSRYLHGRALAQLDEGRRTEDGSAPAEEDVWTALGADGYRQDASPSALDWLKSDASRDAD